MISYNTHNKLSVVQEQNAYLLKNKQCMLENQQKVKIIRMYEVSNYMKNRNMSIIKQGWHKKCVIKDRLYELIRDCIHTPSPPLIKQG